MTSSEALQRAAQAWCTDTTRYTEMDSVLAVAFADILDEEWKRRPSDKALEDEK